MASPAHKTAGTNWLFVRIDTDSGVSGWGEGSLQYKDAALEAEILDFGRFLEGKDPRRIDWIWTSLYRRVTWAGGPVSMSAISAIDLALWDMKAKMLDIPVWQLAGGMHREKFERTRTAGSKTALSQIPTPLRMRVKPDRLQKITQKAPWN